MPRSSLLVMVSALAGIEPVRAAYQDALDAGYRFLSFGDAMFIEGRATD
jgi:S-adenosylmethionine:tRNA ribosyltransferase-isomerase